MRKASRVLRGVPTGLNVPRSGLVSAALLARWPREAMEALRVVARAVEGEGSEGAVKSVGEGKEKGKEKGEEMGEIGEKAWGEAWWEKEGDEVVARAAAVVARQLREDYVVSGKSGAMMWKRGRGEQAHGGLACGQGYEALRAPSCHAGDRRSGERPSGAGAGGEQVEQPRGQAVARGVQELTGCGPRQLTT